MQSCAAKGSHNCEKKGHFAKYCNSLKTEVKNITKVEPFIRNFLKDSDDDICFTLTGAPGKSGGVCVFVKSYKQVDEFTNLKNLKLNHFGFLFDRVVCVDIFSSFCLR